MSETKNEHLKVAGNNVNTRTNDNNSVNNLKNYQKAQKFFVHLLY